MGFLQNDYYNLSLDLNGCIFSLPSPSEESFPINRDDTPCPNTPYPMSPQAEFIYTLDYQNNSSLVIPHCQGYPDYPDYPSPELSFLPQQSISSYPLSPTPPPEFTLVSTPMIPSMVLNSNDDILEKNIVFEVFTLSSPPPNARPKNQKLIACDYCHEKKRRCDFGDPCGRCINRGIACQKIRKTKACKTKRKKMININLL